LESRECRFFQSLERKHAEEGIFMSFVAAELVTRTIMQKTDEDKTEIPS
jgi:hypothetical protein